MDLDNRIVNNSKYAPFDLGLYWNFFSIVFSAL